MTANGVACRRAVYCRCSGFESDSVVGGRRFAVRASSFVLLVLSEMFLMLLALGVQTSSATRTEPWENIRAHDKVQLGLSEVKILCLHTRTLVATG